MQTRPQSEATPLVGEIMSSVPILEPYKRVCEICRRLSTSIRRLAICQVDVTLSLTVDSLQPHFIAPNWFERAINRVYGTLASVGLGPPYSFLMSIKGRKTGTPYSTPVNLLRLDQRIYLVGTRGHTQWSRNALVVKTATLKRGRVAIEFSLRALADAEKPAILKAYLCQFNWMVRRFFPIPSDAPVSSFAAIASDYPVFELSRQK